MESAVVFGDVQETRQDRWQHALTHVPASGRSQSGGTQASADDREVLMSVRKAQRASDRKLNGVMLGSSNRTVTLELQ